MNTINQKGVINIQLFYWFGITLIILVADYFAGPYIQFPVTYLIPIGLASWYNGRKWGMILAVIMPVTRLFFNIVLWTIPWTWVEASVNCVIRITVFTVIVVLIDKVVEQNKKLSKEVDMLSGLLPICSNCKKIRDGSNKWEQIETYITDKSHATFTHSLCPECIQKLYGEDLKKLREQQNLRKENS